MLKTVEMELRKKPRKNLTGLLPGMLKIQDKNEPLNAKAVDISEHGLGLLIDYDISVDAQINLYFRNQIIALKIKWRQQDLGRQNRFRYGTECQDLSLNLEEIFTLGGCLK